MNHRLKSERDTVAEPSRQSVSLRAWCTSCLTLSPKGRTCGSLLGMVVFLNRHSTL